MAEAGSLSTSRSDREVPDHIDPAQYDRGAADFMVHMEQQPYNVLYERPATRKLIGDVAGRDVLDVACGAGSLLAEMSEAGATVVGSDASSDMLELARPRVGPDVALHVHDCSQPFSWAGDASFDLVVMALAYHYVNDHDAFLAEMHRVLRPGGSMVISTHHPTDDYRRLGGSYFTKALNVDRWGNGLDVAAWRMPLHEITQAFHRAGFLIEQLVEPRPVSEMQATDPHVFAKLEACPAFILFRLVKR